jgi:hypothetical protein
MYDSKIGRWHSTDPYKQYASGYVGMGNNPVSNADPDGGMSVGMAWRLGGMVVGGIAGGLIDKDNRWRGVAIGMAAGFAAGYGLSKVNLSGLKLPNLELPGPGFWNTTGDVLASAGRYFLQESFNGKLYGVNEQKEAFNFMWQNSVDGNNPIREVAAFVVDDGILVQPWKGKKFGTDIEQENSATRSYNNYFQVGRIKGGGTGVLFEGKIHRIKAQIHTHPAPHGDYDLSSGDYDTRDQLGVPVLSIGPNKVRRSIPGHRQSRHIFDRKYLSNKGFSIYDWLK